MIRNITKLFAVTVALTAFLHVAPVLALSPLTFVASRGVDTNPCTAALPCATISQALATIASGGQITCLDATGSPLGLTDFSVASSSVTIDCPGTIVPVAGSFGISFTAPNQVFKIRNLTFDGTLTAGGPAISVSGSGTLILENCVFENLTGIAIDIEPTGPLNLVITNSRISNNTAAGVLIKPASGGSVTATFDGVIITNNAGGLKTDTTNGSVTVDIFNSIISKNANNGLIAIGGAGGQNMMNLSRDVIASNGQVGIEASGTNAAALVDTTLLDSNTGGAISGVSGGRILTYQNNRIVGSPGTGFTGTAAPQ